MMQYHEHENNALLSDGIRAIAEALFIAKCCAEIMACISSYVGAEEAWHDARPRMRAFDAPCVVFSIKRDARESASRAL